MKTELEDTKEELKKIKLTWTKLRVGLKGWRRLFLRLRILKKNCPSC